MLLQSICFGKGGTLNHAGPFTWNCFPSLAVIKDNEILWRHWRAEYTKKLRKEKKDNCPICNRQMKTRQVLVYTLDQEKEQRIMYTLK